MNSNQEERLFIGIFPGGIVYADRKTEVHGDYKRLAFLSHETLQLKLESDCPLDLADQIANDVETVRKKKQVKTDACGSFVTLGGRRNEQYDLYLDSIGIPR